MACLTSVSWYSRTCYMSYFTFTIYQFRVKSEMIIFSQPSHSMGFCMWTTKWKCMKLRWGTWDFYWFLLYIFVVLNMILMLCPFTLNILFSVFPWSINPYKRVGSERCFWNTIARLMYVLLIVVFMTICESLVDATGSFTIVINIVRNLFLVAFKPYTTYLPCPGAPTPWSITMLYAWDKIDDEYNVVAHLYLSAHSSVFSLIVMFLSSRPFCSVTVP